MSLNVLQGLLRRFWIVVLGTVAACAYFAASGTSSLVAAMLIPRGQTRVRYPDRVPLRRPPKDLSALTERNIFCSSCAQTLAVTADADAADLPEENRGKTTLPLQLIATLHGPQRAFATIRDDEGRVGLYAVGDRLPGDAELADIDEQMVLLSVAGRLEQLPLERGTPGKKEAKKALKQQAKPRRRRKPLALPAEVTRGIRRLTGPRWEIQRAALDKILGNTVLLARSARIVPSSAKGKPNGFRLAYVRRGGIYYLIGLRAGDTVHAINGRPITTPENALQIYTKLRNSSRVTMSFTRRGKPHTNEYIIRR